MKKSALLFSTLFVLHFTTLLSADRVAFIVGVNHYDHLPAEAQLRLAVSDSELIAGTLSALPEPFEVTLLTNPTREEVSRGLDTFVAASKNAHCAVVFFAGHGIEFHGENYLLVRDTSIAPGVEGGVRRVKDRLYYESLSLHKVMEDLSETQANLQIVILDACRDNPLDLALPNGTRSILGSRSGLGRVNAPSGMLISYSADAGQQANDGLFTEILSGEIKVPGSTLMEVFARTRSEVRKRATILEAEGKGIIHEPAEYSKLEPSALKFSFVKDGGDKVSRGFLGVHLRELDSNLAKALGRDDLEGVLVSEVGKNSPGESGGMQSGDLIIKYNGQRPMSMHSLRLDISNTEPGSEVDFLVVRKGEERTLKVVLGNLEDLSQVISGPVGGSEGSESMTEPSVARAGAFIEGVKIANIDENLRKALELSNDIKGVIVEDVNENSSAAQAGLRPGVIITHVDQQKVTDVVSANEVLRGFTSDMLLLQFNIAGRIDIMAVPLK